MGRDFSGLQRAIRSSASAKSERRSIRPNRQCSSYGRSLSRSADERSDSEPSAAISASAAGIAAAGQAGLAAPGALGAPGPAPQQLAQPLVQQHVQPPAQQLPQPPAQQLCTAARAAVSSHQHSSSRSRAAQQLAAIRQRSSSIRCNAAVPAQQQAAWQAAQQQAAMQAAQQLAARRAQAAAGQRALQQLVQGIHPRYQTVHAPGGGGPAGDGQGVLAYPPGQQQVNVAQPSSVDAA